MHSNCLVETLRIVTPQGLGGKENRKIWKTCHYFLAKFSVARVNSTEDQGDYCLYVLCTVGSCIVNQLFAGIY